MLVLGVAGGLYTLVYAFWVRKSGDDESSDVNLPGRLPADDD